MLLIISGVLLVVISYIYYELTKHYNYWHSKGAPFEKPVFFFGSLKETILGREHFTETLTRLYVKYANCPYFGIYIFHKPVLIVKDPDVLRRVMVKDFDAFKNYAGPGIANTDPMSSNSLIGVKDDVWKNLRSKLTPVFTSGKLKLMFPYIQKCCENYEAYLGKHDSQVLDIRDACRKLSVDIISSCAFGIETDCLKRERQTQLFEMASRLLDFTKFTRVFSLFSYFYMPELFVTLKLTFADKIASDYLVDAFKASYRERTERNIVRHDLIEHLHNLKKVDAPDDNYKFDDVRMASQAISFFIGGNDTTSITATYALYELALNPDVCDRLREEINQSGEITYEKVLNMKYLDMVLAESQRVLPSGTSMNRISGVPYHFAETNFTLDKDINILIPFCAIHLDENNFPEPRKFDPERFNEENKINIKPFTFIPFGEGPRSCIGQRFGLLVVKLTLIYAVKNFKFRICDETLVPMELESGSILFVQPKGNKLFLKVEKI